jgi:hypothetical protein
MGVGGQLHAPAALPHGNDPVPIVQEAALDGCEKSRPHQDFFFLFISFHIHNKNNKNNQNITISLK